MRQHAFIIAAEVITRYVPLREAPIIYRFRPRKVHVRAGCTPSWPGN